MTSEFEKYIPEIQKRNLGEIPEGQIVLARRLLGDWVVNLNPTDKQMENARNYLASRLKVKTEMVFATIIHNMAAKYISQILANHIQMVDGPTSGLFSYKVGLTPNRIIQITKIRSLRDGAMGALGSDHFIEAMWQDNEDYLKPTWSIVQLQL